MLAHREITVQNQVQIEPGVLLASQFLQTALSCQPNAIRTNLDATASTQLIGKCALSIGNTELCLKQVTRITTADQEAFNNTMNRFQKSGGSILLLNLGPAERHYYTRQQKIVLKPGDLLLVAPLVSLFYSESLVHAVFFEEKKLEDTFVLLMEA